jgi:hypothetical protein
MKYEYLKSKRFLKLKKEYLKGVDKDQRRIKREMKKNKENEIEDKAH